MALWQRIKRFNRSLVILAISCLVLEQVLYSVVVPGYFLGVLVSPVFWGLVSAGCFLGLRATREQSDFDYNAEEQCEYIINPATGYLMAKNSCFDVAGNFYSYTAEEYDD